MAHYAHSPVLTIGPYSVETSKIGGLFIYVTAQQITALLERGKYTTRVLTATPNIGNTGDDSASSGGIYSDKNRTRTYTVTVAGGGALGVATLNWTTDKGDDQSATPVVVPVNGVVNLGTKGITLTFNAGPDAVLIAGNKWIVKGDRTFTLVAALQQTVILEGSDFAAIAVSAPDATLSSIFAVVAKKSYQELATRLGWIGTIEALDEL